MQSSQSQSAIPRTLAVLGLAVATMVLVMVAMNSGLLGGAGNAVSDVNESDIIASGETETVAAVVTTGSRSYTVQSGDTLDEIARKHDTSIDVIVDMNPGIVDPYNLMPGTRVMVP